MAGWHRIGKVWQIAGLVIGIGLMCAWAGMVGDARAQAAPDRKPASPTAAKPSPTDSAEARKSTPDSQQAQEIRGLRNIRKRMSDLMDKVLIEGVSAKRSFAWWSKTTDVSLVIDWEALAKDGIDPEKPISLDLKSIPAGQVLALLMRQTATEQQPLMYEITPWYVQITTKAQADRKLVVRMYQVRDLVHAVPQFPPPPEFDLNTALSQSGTRNTSSGGSTSTSQGLFTQQTMVASDNKTETQRGEELAKLIMDTIEPGIWTDQGGNCTIKYHDGRLIVSAPLYIHAQIGDPETSPIARSRTADRVPWSKPTIVRSDGKNTESSTSRVSSVQPDSGFKVSGISQP